MAHTHRDTLNYRRRQRWRKWDPRDAVIGDFNFDYSDPLNRYPRLRGGNMVMAPSASGIWSDERFQRGPDRRRQRRTQKRSERQGWQREVLDILAGVR